LRGLERDRSPRARDAVRLAERWARAAGGGQGGEADVGTLLAEAFPERVAKARGKPGELLLASGRGAFLDPTEALAREPWLAVAELGGGDARDRIHRIDTQKCPLTLLTGEYDYSCTAEHSAATAAKIPGARFQRMDGIGHFPFAENPDLFLDYLLPELPNQTR
jgi:pimeloyl-ACP methyl ester carboxylesterase